MRELIELRRIPDLPPYAFAEIDALKLRAAARRGGRHRSRLRQPGHRLARDRRREAGGGGAKSRNHRYSASRGIPNLRQAICELYERRFGVTLDPEPRGDHDDRRQGGARAPALGAASSRATRRSCRRRAIRSTCSRPRSPAPPSSRWRMGTEEDVLANIADAYERTRPKPRVVIASFPHNPTTTIVDAAFMQALVDFARERSMVVVHDFAYADIAFDGHAAAVDPRGRGRKDAPSSSTRSRRASRWRAGASGSASGTRRSSPGSGGSSRTSTTARSSRSRSPRR